MASDKQRAAARKNVKKAQSASRSKRTIANLRAVGQKRRSSG
jgi:hypothetical protein